MPIQNIGTDVINAYLAGARLKEAREERIAQSLYRQQQLEQAQQRIDEGIKEFKEKMGLETKKYESDAEYNKARINQIKANLNLQGINTLSNLKTILKPGGGRVTIQDIVPGFEGPQLEAQTPPEISQQKVGEAGEVAGAQAKARFPYEVEKIEKTGEIAANRQLAQQQFLQTEWEKNRRNVIEAANIRAQATLARTDATKEEKKAAQQDAIEANLPDIYTGQVALEDIPKGDIGVKIQSAAKSQGYRIFTRKERDRFNETPDLANFIDKVKALNTALRNYDFREARNLRNSLEADLGLFARNTKAEKGNMSNQDIGRMAELLPGWTYSNEQNETRAKEIENIYFDKMDQTFRGMNPVQKQAVIDRWGIRVRPSEVKKNAAGDEIERIE